MTKACEYSKMCDADVFLGIRLHETGHVFFFGGCFRILGFSSLSAIRQCRLMESPPLHPNFYYPTPKLVTDRGLEVI
jgi:hypothetical protein